MLTLNRLKATAAAFALPLALGATVTLAHAQTTTLEPPAAAEQQPLRVEPPAASEAAPVEPAMPDAGAAAPEAAAPQAPSPGASAGTASDSGTSTAAVTQDLIGQPVLDNEGNEVGSVASLKVDETGKLEEIHVKTGGIFGFGAKTLVVPAGKFTESGKDVKLRFAKSELDQMPELGASKS